MIMDLEQYKQSFNEQYEIHYQKITDKKYEFDKEYLLQLGFKTININNLTVELLNEIN